MEVAYTSISLFYGPCKSCSDLERKVLTDPAYNVCTSDLLAFSCFIFLAKRSKASGLKTRMVLDVIAEDATWYFLVIFTSHLVLVLTLNFGRVSAIVPFPWSTDDDRCVSH